MLLDSNILIYFSKNLSFSDFLLNNSTKLFASKITLIEVYGFSKLKKEEEYLIDEIFNSIDLLEIDDSIIQKAISLRQEKNMSLGDSIIAATALVHDLPLVTANTKDFNWIESLKLINPLSY